MGNKSGKFNVTAAEKTQENGAEPKVEGENEVVEANGDHPNGGTTEATETTQKKSKNPLSWLKKVSMRKPKKEKVPKENGVKAENGEVAPENGDVEHAQPTVEDAEHKENGVTETVEEKVPEVSKEEDTPAVVMNGTNEPESAVVENTQTAIEAQ